MRMLFHRKLIVAALLILSYEARAQDPIVIFKNIVDASNQKTIFAMDYMIRMYIGNESNSIDSTQLHFIKSGSRNYCSFDDKYLFINDSIYLVEIDKENSLILISKSEDYPLPFQLLPTHLDTLLSKLSLKAGTDEKMRSFIEFSQYGNGIPPTRIIYDPVDFSVLQEDCYTTIIDDENSNGTNYYHYEITLLHQKINMDSDLPLVFNDVFESDGKGFTLKKEYAQYKLIDNTVSIKIN